MSRSKRVINVLTEIIMFLAGMTFFMSSTEASLWGMMVLIEITMLIRGWRSLWYYLTIARFMVGGKTVLYRSIILFDLAALAGSLLDNGIVYAIIYLALMHAFSGVVDALRANEARKNGAHWKLKMAIGVTNVLLALFIVIGGVVYKHADAAVLVYGAGLIYSAVLRIASAFRRTDIVYIQ